MQKSLLIDLVLHLNLGNDARSFLISSLFDISESRYFAPPTTRHMTSCSFGNLSEKCHKNTFILKYFLLVL